MYKNILLLSIFLIFIQVGVSQFKCESSHMISCTMQIQKAVKKCSSEKNVKECIDQLLQNSVCLSCLCDIVPSICYDEKTANVQQKEEIEEINEVLGEMAECGQIEQYKCQNIIRKSVKQCGSSDKQCILKSLTPSKCNVCLCKVDPDTCVKLKLDKNFDPAQEMVSNQEINNSPFESFESLLSLIPQKLKNEKKEEQTVQQLDSLIQMGLNFFQQNKIQNNEEEKSNEPKKPNNILDMLKNSEITPMNVLSGLMANQDNGLADIQNQLMKNEKFQNIQQQLIQKVMANPQLLSKMMTILQGEKPDLSTLMEIVGGTDLAGMAEEIQDEN